MAEEPKPAVSERMILANVHIAGREGRFDLELERGLIARVAAAASDAGTDRVVAPAFIDAHVHLVYEPVAAELVRHGVIGAVDLAAPMRSMGSISAGTALRVIASGPMITAPRGYPTRGWGRDGYGLECSGTAECESAIDRVLDAGAKLIKIPLAGYPEFDDAELAALIAKAHARHVKVAVHALDDTSARRAAIAGADVLAHTPVEPLTEETLALWGSRAVISTLTAFGAAESTIENLRALRARGATIMYGTDLGNTSALGINGAEIRALGEAGLDTAAIIEAATKTPARYFGFEDLGELAPGKSASLVVYDDLEHLETPAEIYVDGKKL